MQKFLILGRPSKPIPRGVNIKGTVDQLTMLKESGRAEIYTLVEDEGYGFAFLIDVASHDELMTILFKIPLGRWGEYQIFPLGTLDAEHAALRELGILS